MITIIGVRFRNVGKVYYFSPRELDICVGDHVIVETARGVEYGFVVLGPKERRRLMRGRRATARKKKKRLKSARRRSGRTTWR